LESFGVVAAHVSGSETPAGCTTLRDSLATDVLQDIPTDAIETSLETLRDIKERIKGFAEPPGDIAIK
jgi:MarR family transcriptional regulator, transcriptional regulator for hemolysin